MDDEAILTLYRLRDSAAVTETKNKYGRLCFSVANNILQSPEDSEECVNDTWLKAWSSIPPAQPLRFSAWLSRVTRNFAVSRLREKNAQKRGGGEVTMVLDELSECVPGGLDPARRVEQAELTEAVNRFLDELNPEIRDVFVARYYYAAPLAELSQRKGWSLGKLKTVLRRSRLKLRNYLNEEGLL